MPLLQGQPGAGSPSHGRTSTAAVPVLHGEGAQRLQANQDELTDRRQGFSTQEARWEQAWQWYKNEERGGSTAVSFLISAGHTRTYTYVSAASIPLLRDGIHSVLKA